MNRQIDLSTFSLFLSSMDRFKLGKKMKSQASNQSLVSSTMSESWATVSSTIASLMFAWAIICQYSPYEARSIVYHLRLKIKDYLNPYILLTIHESTEDRLKRSEAYQFVEAYLSATASSDATRLRADMDKDGSDLMISMDDRQEITDVFRGVKMWWSVGRNPATQGVPYNEQGRRFYVLTFHRKYRELVTKEYLDFVMKQGKEARARTRTRKLYTNIPSASRLTTSLWTHVVFEHPAKLESVAMDAELKNEIFEDLMAFSKNKEFYERAGKAWKRGYLLHGPPGTGKSTLVAAMANLLNYDIYDLELTAVKDNTELRKLLIETTSKSIILLEDIDCSLDLTGQRKKVMVMGERGFEEESQVVVNNGVLQRRDARIAMMRGQMPARREAKDDGSSRVTLSGLLNFIDGIWSSCGNERLIIFTTNHLDKLDPALIRRGRMDKHIELSYCSFEGFKVFAKNYLRIEAHQMFDEIERLIGEVKITPADVAENLVPKSREENPKICLSKLIRALEEAKRKQAEGDEEHEDEETEKPKAQTGEENVRPTMTRRSLMEIEPSKILEPQDPTELVETNSEAK